MLRSYLSFTPASISGMAALGVVMLCLYSCGSARRGVPVSGKVPDSQPFLQGEKVFMAHCNHCHPSGTAGLGPALNNKPLPRWVIAFQVRNGLGVMPSFPEDKISEKDLDNLTYYLDTLRDLSAGNAGAGEEPWAASAPVSDTICITYRPGGRPENPHR